MICVVRLPAATWRAMLAASSIGSSSDRDKLHPMPKMAITPSAMAPHPTLAPQAPRLSQLACKPYAPAPATMPADTRAWRNIRLRTLRLKGNATTSRPRRQPARTGRPRLMRMPRAEPSRMRA
jgi:hypothetical protein